MKYTALEKTLATAVVCVIVVTIVIPFLHNLYLV